MLDLQLPFITSSYRVIVGAPKSNVTARSGSAILERYGAVFRCEYPGAKPCEEIPIDKRGMCRTLLVSIQNLIYLYL